jgi:hypothetical protein
MQPTHLEVTLSRLRFIVAFATVAASLLLVAGASAHMRDRNHDRIPDRWEKKHHLSLHVKQTRRDQDHDGLNDLGEFKAGTNPRDADSNDNGIEDGAEHAGTISSFSNGVLTIALDGGGTLTGNVTDATEIECHGASMSSDGGPSGDDNGDQGDNDDQGDDNGDQGDNDDQGDDNGDQGMACDQSALTKNASVDEAELSASNGSATFRKIELGS